MIVPEPLTRSDLEARTQGRARFHKLIDLTRKLKVFPSVTYRHDAGGIEARRKIIEDFLNKPVEYANDLDAGAWNKVNEAIKLHFGLVE